MDETQSLAEWGEYWLRAWIDEAGSDTQLREEREWLASHKRAVTLDKVVRDWWHHGRRDLEQHFIKQRANNDLLLYVHEQHALPIWRAFLFLRAEAEPIPEAILVKFEQWGQRLVALSLRNASGKLPADSELARFDRLLGPLSSDDDTATLQALELTGTRKRHVSFKRLRDTELRRETATKIDRLRRGKVPWARIAKRLGVTEQAAKDCYYEFVPSTRSRKSVDASNGLAAAVQNMTRLSK